MHLLECFGVGTVTMDKQADTDEIQVSIKSLTPEADGLASTTAETKTVTTQSSTGDTHSSTTLQTNTVPAKWFPEGGNRVTSPDVLKGSQVVVYKFQGTNTYRWTALGQDGTRRLENIVYAFSASPNRDVNTPVTADNFYMMMINTRQKKIQLVTGQGNGEPTNYVLELDTGTGQFSIVDGESNIFSLNSMSHALSFINAEQTFFNFEKKNITLSCKNQLLLESKDKLIMQAVDIIMKASNSINTETNTTTWVSPTFNLKGDVIHQGNYEQTGNYQVTGNVSVTGGLSQSGGKGEVSGGWTIDGVNYRGHRHTNGNDGGDTGPVIG